MDAIKCDFCRKLEAGTGYLIDLVSEYRICTSCFSKLDSLKEKLVNAGKKAK